jgi:hypothetical protein
LFNSETQAEAAFSEWTLHPELIVLVSADNSCNGDEVGTFEVGLIRLDRSKLEIVTSASLDRSEIVTDWNVVVNQFDISDLHNQEDAHKSSISNLHKRNMWADFQQAVKPRLDVVSNHIRRIGASLSNTSSRTRTRHYDLTANFNKSTQAPIKERMIMFETMQASAYCDNCYTVGDIDVYLELKGRGPVITMYNLTVKGEFRANMDLQVILLHEFESWPLFPIVEIPFFPVNIRGVVRFVDHRAEYLQSLSSIRVSISKDGVNSVLRQEWTFTCR